MVANRTSPFPEVYFQVLRYMLVSGRVKKISAHNPFFLFLRGEFSPSTIFYHGKSPLFTTIWRSVSILFQAPYPSKSKKNRDRESNRINIPEFYIFYIRDIYKTVAQSDLRFFFRQDVSLLIAQKSKGFNMKPVILK